MDTQAMIFAIGINLALREGRGEKCPRCGKDGYNLLQHGYCTFCAYLDESERDPDKDFYSFEVEKDAETIDD